MADGKIHIKGKVIPKATTQERTTVRLTADAYNALVDIANNSSWSMTRVASEIIKQGSALVVLDKDGEEMEDS